MAGGLMQLVSQGQSNVLLNGNPSKTFFKTTFAKYTNFGMQHFRVDFEGSKSLQLTNDSTFVFKIPRYAELLMDAYISVDLPAIWSPVVPPVYDETTQTYTPWSPYEFRWIRNLGTSMIRTVSITCGNQTLQEYSGSYLNALVERDFTNTKKDLYHRMTGNVPDVYDPTRGGKEPYPTAYYTTNPSGAAPSLPGRNLQIPLGAWFTQRTQQAFPLVALQYNELRVSITFRPINELFVIRDVYDVVNGYPYVAPNFNSVYMQMYRFLQPPPDTALTADSYIDTRSVWDANIYLNCTYCFLSNDESKQFALNEQKYLISQVVETPFYNVTGPNKVELNSMGMVKDYLFFFRRSDANLRNEWTNYSNWAYTGVNPAPLVPAAVAAAAGLLTPFCFPVVTDVNATTETCLQPDVNPNGSPTGITLTPVYRAGTERDILLQLGVLLDGEYREDVHPANIYNYIEKYARSLGNGVDGVYCYDFCMHTSPSDLQPSGAISMSRFNKIELEFTTTVPPLDPLAQSLVVCDPQTGDVVGINKPTWRIYQYNYDLYVFEERVNMVVFVGGNAALLYAT
jgi:Major capsid protein N-terminus